MNILRRVRSRNIEASEASELTVGSSGRSSFSGSDHRELPPVPPVPPLPDSGPMVVLNWQPDDLYDHQPDPHLERQRAELERLSQLRLQSPEASRSSLSGSSSTHAAFDSSPPPIILNDASYPGEALPPPADAEPMPPGYEESRFPTVEVTYSFSPTSSGMLLVPPASHPDSRPLYHISVQPNVFTPIFYKTRVTRGGSIDGEDVGDFEMSLLPPLARNVSFGVNQDATVCVRGKEHMLDMILTKEPGYKAIFQWRFVVARMKWDCSFVPYRCLLHADETVLAEFAPAKGKREPNSPPPLATLKILPPGFKYLDDIVVSILAIERKRLTPDKLQIYNR